MRDLQGKWLPLLQAGKFDVGHASPAPMMIARDKGLPVKAIANFVRRNDIGLLVPRGTLKGPKELAGKKLDRVLRRQLGDADREPAQSSRAASLR